MYEIIQVAGKLNTRLANGIYAILRCEKQTIKLRNFKNAILWWVKQTFNFKKKELWKLSALQLALPRWWRGLALSCLQMWERIHFFILTTLTCNPSTICEISQEYPKNTVRGRVCLGLRLDWDLNSTKETSDIYVKPRSVASHFLKVKVEETFLLVWLWNDFKIFPWPQKKEKNFKTSWPQVNRACSDNWLVFIHVLHYNQVILK